MFLIDMLIMALSIKETVHSVRQQVFPWKDWWIWGNIPAIPTHRKLRLENW